MRDERDQDRTARYGLNGMVFVVTGAARGIGAATSEFMVDQGAHVVISDVDQSAGRALAARLEGRGSAVSFQRCDVSDEDSVAALMRFAGESHGRIDVLHNNAAVTDAIVREELTLDTLSVEEYRRILDVNVLGPTLCAKHALPWLKRSANPSIINAGSITSIAPHEGTLLYTTSKSAVVGLTRALAIELGAHGVRVNCYAPGVVRTEMLDAFVESKPDGVAYLDRLERENILPRLGEEEDIAHLIAFLASPYSRYVTGVAWPIDGGNTAWRGLR